MFSNHIPQWLWWWYIYIFALLASACCMRSRFSDKLTNFSEQTFIFGLHNLNEREIILKITSSLAVETSVFNILQITGSNDFDYSLCQKKVLRFFTICGARFILGSCEGYKISKMYFLAIVMILKINRHPTAITPFSLLKVL